MPQGVGGGPGPTLSAETQVETTDFLGKPAGRLQMVIALVKGHLATGQNCKVIAKCSSSNQVTVGCVCVIVYVCKFCNGCKCFGGLN